jgi:ferredoxin
MATILRLDPIRCDGYGMCAELLPELVSLDEWGYPVIRPGAIPDHLLDHARQAVDVCPVLALRLLDASTTHRRQTGPEHHAVSAVTATARADAPAWQIDGSSRADASRKRKDESAKLGA